MSFVFTPVRRSTPPGFADELLMELDEPVALAFTPDKRLLVTTKAGTVHVYQDGALLPTPALDWRERVCTERERGMSGLAVDPDFATNHYVYLYYTFKKFADCPTESPQSPVNRVVRMTLPDSNIIDPTSEVVLVDNIFSYGSTHNAGDLQFGNDGYLYVSIGDSGRDYAGRETGSRRNQAARDANVLLGKVLRITAAGGIPPTNPFLGPDSARCAERGITDAGKKCQETFALGLRNPFRMAFDPNTTVTRFFINDTGQDVWEEINLGRAGADYGWNVREGHCARDSRTECGGEPDGMTPPFYDYGHKGCAAITGGAFIPNGVWPSIYDGSYFFSDFACPVIFEMKLTGKGAFSVQPFVRNRGLTVSLRFGPHGAGQALYYTTFANGGEVRRIVSMAPAPRSEARVVSAATQSNGREAPGQTESEATQDAPFWAR